MEMVCEWFTVKGWRMVLMVSVEELRKWKGRKFEDGEWWGIEMCGEEEFIEIERRFTSSCICWFLC